MIIGLPKEVKDNEYRVAMLPGGVRQLVDYGHEVVVQAGAGKGSGFGDEEYEKSGARLVSEAQDAWLTDLVVKVKEPQPVEYDFLTRGQVLFTFLHLAAERELTLEMAKRGVTGIAYETVECEDGSLPLLIPMSEVAGRMAVQVGARYLQKTQGGRGKLIGGIAGVRPADVTILGAGVVGTNAAQIALGMGGNLIVLDVDLERLRYLDQTLHGRVTTLSANPVNIAEAVKRADLLIGAVLVKGARAPRLVTAEMVRTMEQGSVVVDVAVDQGGCVATSAPTTHSDPVKVVEGVLHYGVTNMPGAVPRTSTYGLSNASIPFVIELAQLGIPRAIREDRVLAKGVNVYNGHVTYRAVAEALEMAYTPLESLI